MRKSLVMYALGVITTLGLAAVVWAQSPSGEVEVRVAARVLEDGRFEVAVQQRAGDGWSERVKPAARFLSAEAEPGRWRHSSGVAVGVPAVEEPSAATAPQEMLCLVTHERPGDEAFWRIVRNMAVRWDVYHPGYAVVVKNHHDPDRQADLVRECMDEGAVAIGATLAAAETMTAALLEAHAAGIPIVTFNSGLKHFVGAKSRKHISVDEVASGQYAGQRLTEAGVSGVVLCIIHEAQNVGLVERCEGLEAGYDGPVERMQVPGVGELSASREAIADRLKSGADEAPVTGILALNTEIGLVASHVVEATGADIVVATFDQTRLVLEAISRGDILFSIDTQPSWQSWYALSSMLFLVRGEPRLRQVYGIDDPSKILGHSPVLIGPRVFTKENAAAWLDLTRIAEESSAVRTEIDE